MMMQTSYPLFDNGQVLTSKHLNDLAEYLEQQDRLTRSHFIGIGVACGLQVSFDAPASQVRVTCGAALTSEGYLLLMEEEGIFFFSRPYTVPVPSVEEAADEVEQERYPYFFKSDDAQRQLWELLPPGHVPGPGEPAPNPLTAAFLADKIVLLFLERTVESLRNCDVSDCSDRGSEVQFTRRVLLVSRADAQAMLQLEQQLSAAPVHRFAHPGYDLQPLRLERINVSGHRTEHFPQLYERILNIAAASAPSILAGLRDAHTAYGYLLAELYPAAAFPDGPFGDPEIFDSVFHQLQQNVFLVPYFYDFLFDLVQSHNEFLDAALAFSAECCPIAGRFPRHVLLGAPVAQPVAFAVDFGQVDPAGYDPLAANTGAGPTLKPVEFRHHFVASPLFESGWERRRPALAERLQQIRSLHYRTYLLALRYLAEDLVKRNIRITPSKSGDYRLSDKAIPFYYAFKPADDLHRSWSFGRTVRNRLGDVYSYSLTQAAAHPLVSRLEDHNFYRVEGLAGKALGAAVNQLRAQRSVLGLAFAIEPVYLGLELGENPDLEELNRQATAVFQRAMFPLVRCRLADLELTFKLLSGTLFYYAYAVVNVLSRANASALAGVSAGDEPDDGPGGLVLDDRLLLRKQIIRADSVLNTLRSRGSFQRKGQLTEIVTQPSQQPLTLGKVYPGLLGGGGNLFDQTKRFARQLEPGADPDTLTQRVYPYMSLLDTSEELAGMLRAPSLADFDFDAFADVYDNFVAAFDEVRKITENPNMPSNPHRDRVNVSLLRNYNTILSAGPQSLIASLAGQLRERVQELLNDVLLGRFTERHPGLEHRGGVTSGGTLVLLCMHRETAMKVASAFTELIAKLTGQVQAGFGSKLNLARLVDPAQAAAGMATGPTLLDQFVVVTDFFVPYLCCGSECLETEPPPDGEPKPGSVSGTVFQLTVTGERVPIRTAQVSAEVMPQRKPVAVTVKAGQYLFSAAAGEYMVTAAAAGFAGQERVVKVNAGETLVEDFVLEPLDKRGVVVGRILSAETGEKLADARVAVTQIGTGQQVDVTVADGEYKFTAPEGEYLVIVNPDAQEFQGEERTVKVVADTTTTADFKLQARPKEGNVQGTILVQVGRLRRPMPRPKVQVNLAGSQKRVKVDVDTGRYHFSAPAGKYVITVGDEQGTFDAQQQTVEVEVNATKTVNFLFRGLL
jgi:hypothetical protein